MRTVGAVLLAVVAFGLGGCGAGPSADSAPPPLTVDEWKALRPEQKYQADSFERLKAGNPKLQTSEGWDAFSKSVIVPARKKDFPNGIKQ